MPKKMINLSVRFEKRISVEEALSFKLRFNSDELRFNYPINPTFEQLYDRLVEEQQKTSSNNRINQVLDWKVIYSS